MEGGALVPSESVFDLIINVIWQLECVSIFMRATQSRILRSPSTSLLTPVTLPPPIAATRKISLLTGLPPKLTVPILQLIRNTTPKYPQALLLIMWTISPAAVLFSYLRADEIRRLKFYRVMSGQIQYLKIQNSNLLPSSCWQ